MLPAIAILFLLGGLGANFGSLVVGSMVVISQGVGSFSSSIFHARHYLPCLVLACPACPRRWGISWLVASLPDCLELPV